MHSRLGRGLLAAALLGALAVPAGRADTSSELEEIRAERAALLEQIEEHEAQAGTLQEEIDALNHSMIVLRDELADLDVQIAAVEARVHSAQARIDATQEQMDDIHDMATRQAVMLYKTAGTEALDALLTAESLAELDERVEFLGVAAAENTGALIEYGRLQAKIKVQHKALFDRKQELNEVRLTQSAILAEMKEKHDRLAPRLAELERMLDEEHRHEGDLALAQAKLEGDLDAYYARQSVEALGTSAQGFIWPLNGAITSYYGPRWGRMHEGIDVDGYTGQAVVASNSGTVVLASYYSGYGNAVVVDHGGGFSTLYGHFSALEVSAGDQVARGEIVGRVGCTGSCTGDHLHFEVRVNGTPVNPLDYLP